MGGELNTQLTRRMGPLVLGETSRIHWAIEKKDLRIFPEKKKLSKEDKGAKPVLWYILCRSRWKDVHNLETIKLGKVVVQQEWMGRRAKEKSFAAPRTREGRERSSIADESAPFALGRGGVVEGLIFKGETSCRQGPIFWGSRIRTLLSFW